MKIVSFEAAKQLKSAGFPQPGIDKGQYWYGLKGRLFQITETEGAIIVYDYTDQAPAEIPNLTASGAYYAPTAGEMLLYLEGIDDKAELIAMATNPTDGVSSNSADIFAGRWLWEKRKVVSFDTAKRLRNAGLPQDKRRLGQIFYQEDGQIIKFDRLPNSDLTAYLPYMGHNMWEISGATINAPAEIIFAPTVDEIIRELPKEYRVNAGQIDVEKYAQLWLEEKGARA